MSALDQSYEDYLSDEPNQYGIPDGMTRGQYAVYVDEQRALRAVSVAADAADEAAPRDPVAMFAWHRAFIEALDEAGYRLEREEDACPCCGEDHFNTMQIRAEAAAANAAAACIHDRPLDGWCSGCAKADSKGCPEHGRLECIGCSYWGLTQHVNRQTGEVTP